MEGNVVSQNTECSKSGCAVKFADRESRPLCVFHPGDAVFHEGLKYWSCCKKKVVNFDDFLRQKGCDEGEHCWTPKPKPEVPKDVPSVTEVVKEVREEIRPMNMMARPDVNSRMVDIQVQVGSNFQRQLRSPVVETKDIQNKKCQNYGCPVSYLEEQSNHECVFHSGEPIFHEGLKYWSCCKKRSMDFDEFLNQKGCSRGEHCWTSKKEVDCRFDWHQTCTHVIGTIYAKGYSPSSVSIKANGIRLLTSFTLQSGVYKQDWILEGIIDESASSATLLSTKLEIKLKKAEPAQWTNFLA